MSPCSFPLLKVDSSSDFSFEALPAREIAPNLGSQASANLMDVPEWDPLFAADRKFTLYPQ